MKRTLIAATATILLAVPALAHHSAAIFDFRSPKTMEGTVREVRVANPHTHMLVSITDAKGMRVWNFEGHSASNFYRAGYTKGAINAGDKIKITFAPMRDGSDGGYIVAFVTPAGDTVGFAPPG